MLIWVDLETTGLDPRQNTVLEVGCIATDDNLEEISRYHSFVQPIWDALDPSSWDEVVQEMHDKSGLLDKINDVVLPKYSTVDHELTHWVMNLPGYDPTIKPYMAGSTINFDRSFVQYFFEDFHSCLHYRNVDVTSIKRMAQMWKPDLMENMPEERKLHRAIPDIEDSLAQMRYFKENWLSL